MGHDQIWSLSIPDRSCQSDQLRSRSSVHHSLAPTKSKAMVAITNSTITHDEADEAARINQDLWIVGYETEKEGSAVSRLKKILGGLRNLSMVGDDAWTKYVQASSAIMHAAIAEDVLDEVPSWLYHPEGNALAEVEEAWLAVGEKARDPSMPTWPGQEVAVTDDSSLAAVEQLLEYTGGIITKAQPQWANRKGATAMGQADGEPCVLKQRRAHGITSAMRLRGGGGNEEQNGGDDRGRAGKRSWQGVDGAWDGPGAKAQRVDDQPRGWGQPTQQQEPDVLQKPQSPPSGWGRRTQHQEQEAPRNPQHPPMPPHLQQIMQQRPCTSQEGHRLLADCHHHPPRCPAAWCGQIRDIRSLQHRGGARVRS